jgi:hypothetical protein
MKRFLRFTALVCAVVLMSLPLFALEETKPEDLPVDADEATVTAGAEPEMPNIKAHPEYSGLVDIKVDFTSVSMSGINSMLGGLSSLAVFPTVSTDKVTMGYSVAMDLGFKFFTGIDLTFGPRLELIGCKCRKLFRQRWSRRFPCLHPEYHGFPLHGGRHVHNKLSRGPFRGFRRHIRRRALC